MRDCVLARTRALYHVAIVSPGLGCRFNVSPPQRKMCGFARRKGVALLAMAPLALGDSALLQHATVLKLAQAHGKTAAQVRQRCRTGPAWMRGWTRTCKR